MLTTDLRKIKVKKRLLNQRNHCAHLQLKYFRFGVGEWITISNNQICFMLRAGNYGRINHPGKLSWFY